MYSISGSCQQPLHRLKENSVVNSPTTSIPTIPLYSGLGRLVEAQAELAEVVRIYPRLSLEHYRRGPYKDPAVIERYMNGLRKAGLK